MLVAKNFELPRCRMLSTGRSRSRKFRLQKIVCTLCVNQGFNPIPGNTVYHKVLQKLATTGWFSGASGEDSKVRKTALLSSSSERSPDTAMTLSGPQSTIN